MIQDILNILYEDLFFLKEVDHNLDIKKLNPYHLEGDVFTHTMMVVNQIYYKNDINLILSALLHDIGKLFTREIKNNKVYFIGHEGVSFYKAKSILDKYENKLKSIDENYNQNIILKSILAHNIYKYPERLKYENDIKFINNLLNLIKADSAGRISENTKINDINLFEYLETKPHKTKEKEVIILCGVPGSGKTTYRKSYEERGYFVICRDDILEEYGKGKYGDEDYVALFNLISENGEQNIIDEMLSKKIKESKKYNKVIIDMTNISIKSQRRFSNEYNSYYKKLVLFNPGFDEILKRNSLRKGKNIGKDVIISMMKKIHYPDTRLFNKIEWIM